MASISHHGNGSRRILFFNAANERKAIRLGKVTKRDAESFKGKLESLLSAKMMGNAPDRETSLWLTTLDDDLHAKLTAHNLVEPRIKPVLATLGVFVDQFIAGRADKAPATLSHYERAKLLLLDFFGADKALADVTPHDADQFRSWMKSTKPHAENTTRGHLKNSKLIFGAAVRARLIVENPFKGISTQLVKRPDRMAFVDRVTIQKVLDACPTSRWKAIVVLCRFGGLRCPSEIFALRWADVDFDRGRLKVRSPKGEAFGKGVREAPLFPEVRQALDELYLEPDGGEFVISTNDRSSQKNLRTVFEKILRKAGVDPWQRLFQNLRASRETELAQEYAIHLVTAWLGNTPKVAMDHYLQVRDVDFDKAAQNPAQQQSATSATGRNACIVTPARNEEPPGFPRVATQCQSLQVVTAPRGVHYSNRGFVELGAFALKRLHRAAVMNFMAWSRPPAIKGPPELRYDPLRLARYYQSLLDSGKFESRAALARFLGVSRARVTQVLNRLKNADNSPAPDADADLQRPKAG